MAWYLETKDLSVGYNKTALIHDINIGIEKGEIVTLIGPNGAGKSTILKSITRQLELIAGTVTIQNEDLHAISYKNLATKMAVVLTDRMKPELMTCYEVVATGRYPYTGRLGILTKEDEKKVEEAMAAVHAVELGNRDFNEISDGQKQRILLARAICQEPEIIILDEPTSFLDIRYKLDLLSILRNMAKEKNITVIMSLHEIDLAQKVADKILCVKGDQIAHYGKPEEIFEENTIRELYDIDNGFFDPLCFLPVVEGYRCTDSCKNRKNRLQPAFCTQTTWTISWPDFWPKKSYRQLHLKLSAMQRWNGHCSSWRAVRKSG